jgi:hypothetical protein
MRTGISITLKPADRRRLKALARDRNTPHKRQATSLINYASCTMTPEEF